MDLHAIPFEFNRSLLAPLLWLGNFAVFFILHLALHPRASYFRKGLRLIGKHPAPVLFFATSAMVATITDSHPGTGLVDGGGHSALFGWHYVWVDCLAAGLRDLMLLFHSAIVIPDWQMNPLPMAAAQSLLGAFSQVWLCCWFLSLLAPYEQERGPFHEALRRWASVLVLAVCYFPWWWWESQPPGPDRFPLGWLLLEFLIFLAPLPLAIAWSTEGFTHAGATLLRWWRFSGLPLLGFAITSLALLTLLQYTSRAAVEVIPAAWLDVWQVLGSLMTATVHLWLFATGALLMLRHELRRVAAAPATPDSESVVEG